MDEQIFKEIAREIKALHNEAVKLIKIERYDEAKKLYEIASSISSVAGYSQGIAMSMYSISNLEILRQDYKRALDYACLSMDYYKEESDKEIVSGIIRKVSLHLVKRGIEMERSGEIERALNLFNQALPYLRGKRREAVLYEINLLRRVKDND